MPTFTHLTPRRIEGPNGSVRWESTGQVITVETTLSYGVQTRYYVVDDGRSPDPDRLRDCAEQAIDSASFTGSVGARYSTGFAMVSVTELIRRQAGI
jgi:hypothetical protein